MIYSSSMNALVVLVVMQVSAQRKCRRAANMVQNNAYNANNDACTTN